MDIFQTTGNTAAALLAGVSSSVQSTLASIAPIATLVIGILLAFVVINYLVSIFHQAGDAQIDADYENAGIDDFAVDDTPKLRRVSTGGDEHQEVYIRS
jgi:divalent metal cation (Fe/Co/Zn/Cd) transporter